MRYSKKSVIFVGILLFFCFSIGSVILDSERYNVWNRGLSYIFYESPDYLLNTSLDENKYSIEIDLNNIDSNTGKRIYENGDCYIEVGMVHNAHVKNGGYRIIFRSYGVSDYVEGKLISGLSYHGFDTVELSAAMQTTYNGFTYNVSSCGYGSLQDDNSDTFGFYLFPTEAYEKDGVPSENAGTVLVTLTNLREHDWRRIRNFDFLTRYVN